MVSSSISTYRAVILQCQQGTSELAGACLIGHAEHAARSWQITLLGSCSSHRQHMAAIPGRGEGAMVLKLPWGWPWCMLT